MSEEKPNPYPNGATLSEIFGSMQTAYEEHKRGERPGIVPEHAVLNERGVWVWDEGEGDYAVGCSWAPGAPVVSCWAKKIYISSGFKSDKSE